jgi:polyphosphate kinase
MLNIRPIMLLGALALPMPAVAHPHVFVDATIEVIFGSDGRVEALRIGWAYDDLFSLTYLAENGYDPDFDGVLDMAEQARLVGFDMGWDADFPGDTYALLGDEPLGLSRPEAATAALEGGRLVSSHLRRFAEPVDLAGRELVVQVYDPSFYTDYTIAAVPVLTGGGTCRVQVFEPDRDAADARLQAALEELAGSSDTEAEFPAIGDAYAEEARVTCAGR